MSNKRSVDDIDPDGPPTKLVKPESSDKDQDQGANSSSSSAQNDDPMSRTFTNGATVQFIYESFTNAIIEDQVMLDVYQQADLKNIIASVRPDFPYPDITQLVGDRFRVTWGKMRGWLKALDTFFTVYLLIVTFKEKNYAIVEVAYFEETNKLRKNVVIGCLRVDNCTQVANEISSKLAEFEIENKCYRVCGLTPDLNEIVDKLSSQLKGKSNPRLPEYVATYGKFTKGDLDNLAIVINECLSLLRKAENDVKIPKKFSSCETEPIATIMELTANVESDCQKIQNQFKNIRKSPEQFHYLSNNESPLDLLCTFEWRKLSQTVKELKANLDNLMKAEIEDSTTGAAIINAVDNNMAVVVHSKADKMPASIIHPIKVLESCLTMINNDMSHMRKFFNDYKNRNPVIKVIQQFQTFVERITERVSEDLWIFTYLIQQWDHFFQVQAVNVQLPQITNNYHGL